MGILLILLVAVIFSFFINPKTGFLNFDYYPSKISKPIASASIHFLDVGQGNSVLIIDENQTILYDCGEWDYGEKISEYLKEQNVSKIDILITSHPHSDHIAGCVKILQEFPIGKIYDTGLTENTKASREYEKNAKTKLRKTIQKDESEGKLDFFTAIDTHELFKDNGDNSLLAKYNYGNISVLLTGDCEFKCEKEILKQANTRSQILYVSHHGSGEASSKEFLQAVKPKIAVISVGKNNEYGHPKQSTLKRLEETGAKVYRTDEQGAIVITTNGIDYNITTEMP